MNKIVEAYGGTIIVGFWNNELQKFTPINKLPRKQKKKYSKLDYKFYKNNLDKALSHSILDWDYHFSFRIVQFEDVYHTYLSVVHDDIDKRDIVYRLKNSDKIIYNF